MILGRHDKFEDIILERNCGLHQSSPSSVCGNHNTTNNFLILAHAAFFSFNSILFASAGCVAAVRWFLWWFCFTMRIHRHATIFVYTSAVYYSAFSIFFRFRSYRFPLLAILRQQKTNFLTKTHLLPTGTTKQNHTRARPPESFTTKRTEEY